MPSGISSPEKKQPNTCPNQILARSQVHTTEAVLPHSLSSLFAAAILPPFPHSTSRRLFRANQAKNPWIPLFPSLPNQPTFSLLQFRGVSPPPPPLSVPKCPEQEERKREG